MYRYTYTRVCSSESSLSLVWFHQPAKCLNFEQKLRSPSSRKQTPRRNCDVSLKSLDPHMDLKKALFNLLQPKLLSINI